MAPNSIGCSLKKLDLRDTGLINILPALRNSKDCEVEKLWLRASEEEHVAGILKQKKPFCVGRVIKMELGGYAVGVITKMSLEDYGVDKLKLTAPRKKYITEILKQEKPFCVGRVKSMWINDYAVGVITKMSHEGCEVEKLILTADKEAHVAAVLEQENPFCLGRVGKVEFEGYAVSVIAKMSIHEDNTIERFRISANEDHFSRILGEKDRSIELGRIRLGGFHVPEEVRRKLRYTLVDGYGKEVLEERDSSKWWRKKW
ncbi:MAG: uncharacterized protein A8A55_2726 [Amphiamblys sp. WSBS2006]|nr:MAG: uncharacterized protein A8A55_2726 [Amphiamblys sp. WSBS2006]